MSGHVGDAFIRTTPNGWPLDRECPECKGTGETVQRREHRDMDITQSCLRCFGEGLVEVFP